MTDGILIVPVYQKLKYMKSLFLTAGIAGVVIAGVIYYLKNTGTGKVMNVEDGFAINA